MNVLENRNINSVIILGCGESILELTSNEKNYINHCKTVIAMNKFMAFYKKSGIFPTHIYFADTHDNSLHFLQLIFNLCKKDNLENLHFILNSEIKKNIFSTKIIQQFVEVKDFIRYHFWKYFLPIEQIRELREKIYLINKNKCSYSFISIKSWMKKMPWANTLTEPLFHYRGSLTSALNYCSIKKPNQEIFLVGNDFYGANYFFEDELKKLPFDYTDWTTQLVKTERKHFSFQNYEGTKMSDLFPFIMECLKKNGNRLYCINKKSLLVSECDVPFKKLPC